MKRMIVLPVMVFLFLATSCGGQADAEVPPEVVEAAQADAEVPPEVVEATQAAEPETLPEPAAPVYTGEIFDVLDEDGYVNVYAEKDEDSEIIHVYDAVTEVHLLETLPFGWFKIRMADGREGYVDARNIRTEELPPHDYDENRTGYVLIFTHDNQRLTIYKDGKFILSSIASSGIPELYTPRGIFEIEDGRRGSWFFVERFNVGMKYWVGFKGIWLFHSVPFDREKNIIEEEAEKLGEPASHGCIRLPVEVAEYIFNNVPDGSLVLIY